MPQEIPDSVWEEISRHWRSGSMSLAALARRYDIHVTTITKHARRHDWPPRDRPRHDPRVTAEVLLADLTIELQHSLTRLRQDPIGQTIEAARERTRLIRETHRAMALRAKTEQPERTAPPEAALGQLDLAAADRDILDHLARLDRAETEPALNDPSPRAATQSVA